MFPEQLALLVAIGITNYQELNTKQRSAAEGEAYFHEIAEKEWLEMTISYAVPYVYFCTDIA